MNFTTKIQKDGFAILEQVLEPERIDELLQQIASVENVSSHRAGIRNLLNVVPSIRVLANSDQFRSMVRQVLGVEARVVRGIYFNKHKDANWKVLWHQDVTIAVRERIDVDGYGPWSIKAGIQHVQPPVSVLHKMLSLRLHLDDTDERNGALRVFAGSHAHGRLTASDIDKWKQNQPIVVCAVKRGGLMAMKPLLVHSSQSAANPRHRRVLHLEYSAADLPAGLEWFEERAKNE
ncbi:MAG TPA: phytanoyl-CoA dioxygenase family protein [Pyrinomonadaceae bacterium]|nr:phytanoyl-CoA dioxygenase family protein [Pyrinomonadaceae bacterium]